MIQASVITRRLAFAGAALVLGAGFALSAYAQTGPSPSRQAVEARKAVFTLIGSNCRALGDVVKGVTPFDSADVQKRVARIAFLSDLVGESFPDASNLGEPDTKAKADIWANKAAFAKKVADLQDHAKALVPVSATEKSDTEAFKTAFAALAQDCKGCHETYRAK
jgi:cytochrome c556